MTNPIQDESLARRFAELWDESDSPPDVFRFLEQNADASPRDSADVVLLDQRRRREQACPLPVETYLDRLPRIAADEELKLELIVDDFTARKADSYPPEIEQVLERFPELQETLLRILSSPGRQNSESEVQPTITLPHDSHNTADDNSAPTVASQVIRPEVNRIDRYRIERVLGEGGCGRVYLAVDEELQRHVAVKVPQRSRADRPETISEFQSEARTLAKLDHAAIVPVYDVGQTDDGMSYVVSKFIEGTDLAGKMEQDPPSRRAAAELIAQIADALHYAHQRGLVHRDVKPGNILIDHHGQPYLTDFGLALKEEDYGTGPSFSGTINYMSPEQARGEGHLVDGRSDIFSLGVVLYRLLVGTRPFRGESQREVINRIINTEPRPPRQLNDSVPKELERICLKALAKRVSDRYTTAKDLADDLRAFIAQHAALGESASGQPSFDRSDAGSVTGASIGRSITDASAPGISIVPKGLRSFDDDDADFFLELLPGPHDRDGLPDSLRFWKRRIEETNPDATFRVGLLYGSSGCGKSSLVKAGLLPRLDDSITTIFVEATPGDTETRLLRGLRKHCPDLPIGLGLTEAISTLRRERHVRPQRKVLIVLDQFEQWLHTRRADEASELVEAMRQCDGEHVQCLLLVRDDFWMSISRFMRELEVPLQEGHNCAAVDRFDQRHARRVLRLYGQAFDALPTSRSDLTKDQQSFLKQSVEGLSDDGNVIPVRLALFAEMIKTKPWTTATLKSVGGAKGVGVAFLDETFSGPSAPPQHRIHQRAARAVLKALLPEHGAGIKGQSRSYQDLLEASGYAHRPREFDDLLHILTQELRILTPIDPEGLDDESVTAPADDALYQLAHDFLVPALQQWLVSKQQETRRGRTELRLAERSAMWSAKPEPQQLPTLWEWSSIRLLTSPRTWTDAQRKMMRVASRRHMSRGLLAALAIVLLAAGGLFARQQLLRRQTATEADALVRLLLDAETAEVPNIVPEFDRLSEFTTPQLRELLSEEADDSKAKLHVSLALLREDADQLEYLLDRLSGASATEVVTIRQVASSCSAEATPELWQRATDTSRNPAERFRAACVLAEYDPAGEPWPEIASTIASHLVSESPLSAAQWTAALYAAREQLVPALVTIFHDEARADTERIIAAEALADYAASDPGLLVALSIDATAKQFAALLPKVNDHREQASSLLEAELNREPQAVWPDSVIPDWPAADAAVTRQVERADGLVVANFAICQTLPLAELDAVVESLQAAGYRLSKLRPYSIASGAKVAALWQRDGLETRFVIAGTPEKLREEDEQHRKDGFLPVDIAAHGEADSTTQYSAVWVRGDTQLIDARMYVGVPDEQHADHWGPLNAASFVPYADLITHDEACQPLFSSVRWKFATYPWYMSRTMSPAELDAVAKHDWFQADLRLVDDAEGEDGYRMAGVWWPGMPFTTKALHGLTPRRHLRQCQELADDGYRPHSVTVKALGGGSDVIAASLWQRPVVPDEVRDALARRQANAVVAIAHLGKPEELWPRLREHAEPYLRSHLIHRLHALGLDRNLLATRLTDEDDVSIRRALLLALSGYSRDDLAASQKTNLIELLDNALAHPDPGVHSAAEFALRKWGAEVSDQANNPSARWYRTDAGHTMAIVSAEDEWKMGSPGHERTRVHHMELQHPKRLGRTLAVSTTEVTVDQFLQFDSEFDFARDYSPDGSCPINMVSWFDAARYCRWLSEQENIAEDEMCYPALDEIEPGMSLPDDFLDRSGYRLPTEAEWEFLCRANTTTARYYGSSPALLPKYAYTAQNSEYRTWPVGQLYPNDFGLFDTLGNLYEWCHDSYDGAPYYPPPFGGDGLEDRPSGSLIDGDQARTMRGGSFLYQPSNARAAHRDRQSPQRRTPYVGFRVVRTMPP